MKQPCVISKNFIGECTSRVKLKRFFTYLNPLHLFSFVLISQKPSRQKNPLTRLFIFQKNLSSFLDGVFKVISTPVLF